MESKLFLPELECSTLQLLHLSVSTVIHALSGGSTLGVGGGDRPLQIIARPPNLSGSQIVARPPTFSRTLDTLWSIYHQKN